MKVKTLDLKSFKANSAFIEQNNILPILAYVKFEKNSITKNNLKAFLVQDIPGATPMLVDEKILMNFVDNTNAPEITITQKGDRVTITDGDTTVSCATDDITHFPTNPTADTDVFKFDEEIMSEIKIASQLIAQEEIPTAKSFVMVGEKSVCSSDGFTAYIKPIYHEVPKVALSKQVCSALAKLNSVSFNENDSYLFFETENCKYGFVKQEVPYFNMTKFAEHDKELPAFTIDKSELLRFNTFCISSAFKSIAIAKMEAENDTLKLNSNDSSYEIDINKSVKISGSSDGSFSYNAAQMNKILKAIPEDVVTLRKVGNKYYITGTTDFTALIMGLQQ